eukprot:6203952-Pyramimonas_sp.AAC.1
MGGPLIVAAPLGGFKFPILEWGRELFDWGFRSRLLIGECIGWGVDAPLHKYADDLNKIVIAGPGDSLPTFLNKLRMIG